jgi:hypothetical protein
MGHHAVTALIDFDLCHRSAFLHSTKASTRNSSFWSKQDGHPAEGQVDILSALHSALPQIQTRQGASHSDDSGYNGEASNASKLLTSVAPKTGVY